MDKIEEVLLDNERVGPPPLESLTADIEATPENLLWCTLSNLTVVL
jgi:hypothetical protein